MSKHVYEVNLDWKGDYGFRMSVRNLEELDVGPPVEFGGREEYLTPEELFISSLASCISVVFLMIARKSRINVKRVRVRATGVMERVDRGYAITGVTLEYDVEVADEKEVERAEYCLKKAEEVCAISRTIEGSRVKVELRANVRAPP